MHRAKFMVSLPLVLGFFAVIYAAMGLVYFGKENESRGLASQIMVMRTSLARPQPDIASLQAKLDKASAESDTILSSLPSSGQGIDVYAALVALGRNEDIDIVRIKSAAPIVQKGGAGNRSTLPYTIAIRGDQDDALAFVESLTEGSRLLAGLEIKSVSIKAATSGGENTAELELWVHTWPDFSQANGAAGQVTGSTK